MDILLDKGIYSESRCTTIQYNPHIFLLTGKFIVLQWFVGQAIHSLG